MWSRGVKRVDLQFDCGHFEGLEQDEKMKNENNEKQDKE